MIPTVALSEVPAAPGLAPRLSADTFNATNRAITAAGGAMQEVGGMLGRFAMQKQDHINKGFLAGEEAVRMQTAAQIEKFAVENPDKPELWRKMHDSTWKSYEQGRAERAKAQGWGPDVQALDKQLAQSYRAEFGIRFNAETDKGLIRQSNARLEAVAALHMDNDNVKGAVAAVEQMTLYPGEAQKKLDQIANGALYNEGNRWLSEIATHPPAQMLNEAAAFEQHLMEKDKDGAYVNGHIQDEQGNRVGGLGAAARTDLVQRAWATKRAAERQMEGEVRRLLSVHALGPVEFNAQAQKAFESGMIQAQIVASPDGLGFTIGTKGQEAKATVTAMQEGGQAALADEAARQALAAHRAAVDQGKMTVAERAMREKATKMSEKAVAGDLSEEAVVAAVKNGDIMDEDSRALIGTIRARAQLDVFRAGLPAGLLDSKGYVGAVSAYASMTNEQKDDVEMPERMAMLGFIDKDPVLSVAAKAEVMKQYLDALNVDLQGWEDNGKTVRPHINGREIDEIEARARGRVGAAFKSAPNLGAGWAGTAMIRAEKDLTDFFTSKDYKADGANKEAADKLVEHIREQVYNLAAASWVGRLYP